MKIACLLLQFGVALGGAILNWHLFGWQPVAVTTASGVISMFFGAVAKRLP